MTISIEIETVHRAIGKYRHAMGADKSHRSLLDAAEYPSKVVRVDLPLGALPRGSVEVAVWQYPFAKVEPMKEGVQPGGVVRVTGDYLEGSRLVEPGDEDTLSDDHSLQSLLQPISDRYRERIEAVRWIAPTVPVMTTRGPRGRHLPVYRPLGGDLVHITQAIDWLRASRKAGAKLDEADVAEWALRASATLPAGSGIALRVELPAALLDDGQSRNVELRPAEVLDERAGYDVLAAWDAALAVNSEIPVAVSLASGDERLELMPVVEGAFRCSASGCWTLEAGSRVLGVRPLPETMIAYDRAVEGQRLDLRAVAYSGKTLLETYGEPAMFLDENY